jgi:hypothetical protein
VDRVAGYLGGEQAIETTCRLSCAASPAGQDRLVVAQSEDATDGKDAFGAHGSSCDMLKVWPSCRGESHRPVEQR